MNGTLRRGSRLTLLRSCLSQQWQVFVFYPCWSIRKSALIRSLCTTCCLGQMGLNVVTRIALEGKKAKRTSTSTSTSLPNRLSAGATLRVRLRLGLRLGLRLAATKFGLLNSARPLRRDDIGTRGKAFIFAGYSARTASTHRWPNSLPVTVKSETVSDSLPALSKTENHEASWQLCIQCRVNQSESPSNSEISGSDDDP